MYEPSEFHVPGHAAFAVAQDVEGAHVSQETVWGGEVAEEVRCVVVGDGAWVVDAE